MTSADRPAFASPAATLIAVVVLLTPPFWLATQMILATFGSLHARSISPCRSPAARADRIARPLRCKAQVIADSRGSSSRAESRRLDYKGVAVRDEVARHGVRPAQGVGERGELRAGARPDRVEIGQGGDE